MSDAPHHEASGSDSLIRQVRFRLTGYDGNVLYRSYFSLIATGNAFNYSQGPRTRGLKKMKRFSIHFRYLTLASANILAGLLGLFGLTMVSGRFGPEGLGDVALATALLTYATVATTGGTELFAIKTVASDRHRLGQMISSVMQVRLLLGSVCYLALLAIAWAFYPDRALLIALFGLALFAAATSISWVPQALHRSGVFAASNVLAQAVFAALIWLTIEAGYDLPVVALDKVAADFLIVFALLWWLRKISQPIESPSPWPVVRRLAFESMPIAGTQLVRMIGLGTDLIILAFLVSREDTGLFAAAFKIFGFLLGLVTAYFVILLPRIAQHKTSDAMKLELNASFKRTLPLAVVAAIAISVLAAPLLSMLFGPAFDKAENCLQLLCLAWLANIGARHYRQVLLAHGRHAVDFHQSAVSCIIHLISRVSLIPFLGIEGAALGMVIGESFLLVAQRRAALRELK